MGKVEKIVVLGVLFVIVTILVVSLYPGAEGKGTAGKDEVHAAGKEKNPAGRVIEREDPQDDPVVHTPSAGPTVPDPVDEDLPEDPIAPEGGDQDEGNTAGLLVAVTIDEPVYDDPEAPLPEWDLITLGGLSSHLFDETNKVYTAKEGDTFAALAETYYGDGRFERLLRRANEGYDEPTAGQQILLPTTADGVINEPVAEALPPMPEGATTYTAGDGESLWVISKKLYGKGHLWPRIWEANKGHRLDNPDFVPEGVTLIIPAE